MRVRCCGTGLISVMATNQKRGWCRADPILDCKWAQQSTGHREKTWALRRRGYGGAIAGALILAVIQSLLSSLGYPEAIRQILFGSIIVAVAAAYTRVTFES